jgi:hypothetical protein
VLAPGWLPRASQACKAWYAVETIASGLSAERVLAPGWLPRACQACKAWHAVETIAFGEGAGKGGRYLTRVTSLNIGRYMERMTRPTIAPTPIIMIGSTIDVRLWIDASTSSS